MLRKLGIGPDPNEITKELIQTTSMKCKTKNQITCSNYQIRNCANVH